MELEKRIEHAAKTDITITISGSIADEVCNQNLKNMLQSRKEVAQEWTGTEGQRFRFEAYERGIREIIGF